MAPSESTDVSRPELNATSEAPAAIAGLPGVSEDAQTSSVATVALPFSLLIEGVLAPEERERLTELVTSRENYGIRPMDLEPMLDAGRILLPRISEYAGVLVIQALRLANVRIEFAPSDLLSGSEDRSATESSQRATPLRHASLREAHHPSAAAAHPADRIPITTASRLPDNAQGESQGLTLIDTVMASTAIRTALVEAPRSEQYQDSLERLVRELKFKAYHKGAQAIVELKTELAPLTDPSHYRLTVSGSAVRIQPEPTA